MKDGKFDAIHEYVDTSGSMLVGFGLKLLPNITKGKDPTRVPPIKKTSTTPTAILAKPDKIIFPRNTITFSY